MVVVSLYERIINNADTQDLALKDISTTLSTAIGFIFKVGATGVNSDHIISSLSVYMKKTGTPASDITAELRDATATAISQNVLSTATVLKTAVSTSYGFVSIGSVDNFTLHRDQYYAVVLRCGVNTGTNGYTFGVTDSAANSYPTFSYCSNDDALTFSINSADVGVVTGAHVINNFKVFGSSWNSATTSYTQVVQKAGTGANATYVDIPHCAEFVKQAESLLNARTRYDWTAAFPDLNENVKYIISEIVSNLAAIKVINGNMAGYTTRLEAEGMKRTLLLEAELYIEDLKDDSVKTFVAQEE